ncbi:MAG: hypothetical protein KAQ98_10465 [Bacteriovoracaceae bacterium]|nr:hypothetical protein [Bacteriovoracaceae bacterium]
MRIREFFTLLFLLPTMLYGVLPDAGESEQIKNSWTYIFFINGDFNYNGPSFKDDHSVEIEDQSRELYKKVKKMAKEDKTNNYVIFYDPRGTGPLFKHVRIKVFKNGKQIHTSWPLFNMEINASSPETFEKLAGIARKELSDFDSTKKLFYFYGEHFPVFGKINYDLSHKKELFGGEEFKSGLEYFAPVDLLVMQTCYVNSISFYSMLKDLVKRFLVPQKAILNVPLNLESLHNSTAKADEIASEIISKNKHDKYPLLTYGTEINFMIKIVNELEKNIFSEDFNDERTIHEEDGIPAWTNEVSTSSVILNTKEVLVPIESYVTVLDQYLKSNKELLDEFENLLDTYPEFSQIYEVFHTL